MKDFKLGQIVYHRDVYEHNEPLKIVGILEDKLLLEGDYSGGTHVVLQRDWLPIKGVSVIKNAAYKQKCRATAVTIQDLCKAMDKSDLQTFDLLDMVFMLTNDVSLNPENK